MSDKYFISLLIPGMKCQGDTLDKLSLGGSETAGVSMARALAKLGHIVKVFSNCDSPGEYDGTIYLPIDRFQEHFERIPGDVAIVQRTPEPFVARSSQKLHLLWCHDLALGRQAPAYRSVCWNVDKFITVSKWMGEQYKKNFGLPSELIYASRNGIDLFRFPKIDLNKKMRKRLVYSARPERGLDVLLDRIFPELLKRDPEFELALFGYDNQVEHLREFYASLAQRAKQFGDKVRFMGNLNKTHLYRAYSLFGIYAYPTPSPKFSDFSEVSCISAMEAMAAGMPIVTSNRGALSETIPEKAGTLIEGNSVSDEYLNNFVEAILHYAHDDQAYIEAAKAGIEHAQSLSWDGVAEDWTEQIGKWLAERNNDRVRLAYHFYRRSDIFAAKKALEDQTSVAAETLRKKIDGEYSFIESEEAFRFHYLKGGEATDKRLSSSPLEAFLPNLESSTEPRFHIIREYLARHEECKLILDYGCGHGWSTIYLGNQLGPSRSWVGVDIDPGAVKWACTFAGKFGKPGVSYTFVEGDHRTKLQQDGQFDVAIVSEVLEHCIDPFSTIEAVEKKIKPGGIMIVTVPFGPSEYHTENWHTFRNHLWEFDAHDLKDIFGSKPHYAVSSGAIYPNPTTGEMIGYHFITYAADHKSVGQIDWDRKLRLQCPRETISASIIAGRGADLTLGWCLNSIKPYVDEIVIADTGLNEIGKLIAEKFGAKLIPGSDPLQKGFETPRNEALDHCSMDWVLWIDTDERLLSGENLMKYLHKSIWHGLSIKQHHFAIDAGFRPDMPVRCYRRGPYAREGSELNGKVMRHYGCVTPDTMIVGNPNFLPISEIVLGAKIRTHTGKYNEVSKIWKYDIEDELLEIQAIGGTESLKITKDHELFAIKTKRCPYEAKWNIRCYNCRKSREGRCSFEFYKKYQLGKIPAGELEPGDILVYPIDRRVIISETKKISDHAKSGKLEGAGSKFSWYLENGYWIKGSAGSGFCKKVKDELEITPELMRLIGYMISYGGIGNVKFGIFFSGKELHYAKDACTLLRKLGLKPTIKRKKGGAIWSVRAECRPFCEWFHGEFGRKSRNKSLPHWAMTLPIDHQTELLRGLWRGDGSVEGEKESSYKKGSLVRYCTRSRILAYQVRELLLRQNLTCRLAWGKHSHVYEIHARIAGKKFLDWQMPDHPKRANPRSWIDGDLLHMKIRRIKTFQYKGPVYDVTVPGDHSFVFGGVAGSNCIHEHPELELNAGPGDVLVLPDVHIAHIGYLDESIRKDRFRRNTPLLIADQKRYPERLLQKHFMMRDNMLLVGYELSQSNGRMTSRAKALAEETIELYQKYFLGKQRYASIDSLQYYTQALQVLGQGIDVAFHIATARDGIGDTINGAVSPTVARFADIDEAKIELNYLLDQKLQPFKVEMW